MKAGIELINEERKEQIEKHGWSLDHDASYADGQLKQAALFCYQQARIKLGRTPTETIQWPDGWIKHFEDKIRNKSAIEQLVVCGAFWLAEYDRTNDEQYKTKAHVIGVEIDHYIEVINELNKE